MDVAAHSTRSDSSTGRSRRRSGGRKVREFPEGSEEARAEWALWLREHLLCSTSCLSLERSGSMFVEADGSLVASISSSGIGGGGSSRRAFAEAAVFLVSGASALAYLSAIQARKLKPPASRSVRSAEQSEAHALAQAGAGPTIVAQSSRIRLSRGEAMALAAALVDPTAAQARGLAVGGERFWPLLVTHECLFACAPSKPDDEPLNDQQLRPQLSSMAPTTAGQPPPTVASIITNMGLVSGHSKTPTRPSHSQPAPAFSQKAPEDTDAEDSDKEADSASCAGSGSTSSNARHTVQRKSDLEVRRRHLFVVRARHAHLVAITNDSKDAGAQLNYLRRLAAFLAEHRI